MLDGMSRRSFVKALAASAVSSSTIQSGLGQARVATTGEPTEWSYASGKQYTDPFNQVDLDALVTLPDGQQERMPAFWAGDQHGACATHHRSLGLITLERPVATPKTKTFTIVCQSSTCSPIPGRTPTSSMAR